MTLDLRTLVRTVPDFPRRGVQFRDLTTLLKHAEGFTQAVSSLASRHAGERIDVVAGIESRGFIVGGAVAVACGCGFVPIRKAGKLPAATFGEDYALEYGTDRLEVHRDAFAPAQRVLVVDDLIATGGTAQAAARLVEAAGATVAGFGFIVDLPDLRGRQRLERLGYRVAALCAFEGA
jgi:adenine phosphoribosyltransferase